MSDFYFSLAVEKKVSLPAWVVPFVASQSYNFAVPCDRMRLVIDLSRENIQRGTGGPFASAVFEIGTTRLVSVGVNVVVPQKLSLAHGEIVALMLAQETLQNHDLGSCSVHGFELVTSAQPCIQCYGALLWSGIRHVVMGARGQDVEELTGFDEGPLPLDWELEWRKRGITADRDVQRESACQVLSAYRAAGAPIYNPGRPS